MDKSHMPGIMLCFLIAVVVNTLDITVGCETGRLLASTLPDKYPEHIHRAGIYLQQQDTFNNHAVYKHEYHQDYLYYMPSFLHATQIGGYWVVGPQLGEEGDHGTEPLQDALLVMSMAASPELVKEDWMVRDYANNSWVPEPSFLFKCVRQSVHKCTSREVNIQGLHPRHNIHQKRMGLYTFAGYLFHLRPVYYHASNEEYLFFINGMWLVGPEVGKFHGSMFVQDFAHSPELITHDWILFNRKYFAIDRTLRVGCADADKDTSDDTARSAPHSYLIERNFTLSINHGNLNLTSTSGNFSFTLSTNVADSELNNSTGEIKKNGTSKAESETQEENSVRNDKETQISTGLVVVPQVPLACTSKSYCFNNGSCFKEADGSRHCLCRPGYRGYRCVEVVICGIPPNIRHGHAVLPPDSKPHFNYLEVVMYRCHAGFHLNGDNGAVCDSNNQWSKPPKCRSGNFHFTPGVPLNLSKPQDRTLPVDPEITFNGGEEFPAPLVEQPRFTRQQSVGRDNNGDMMWRKYLQRRKSGHTPRHISSLAK